MELYQSDYVFPRIKKQIAQYTTEYGYSYSGILKALKYYYEIKKNPFDKIKAKESIGIVPYIYQNAYNYYYAIWEAQQHQANISDAESIQQYIPKVIEIKIPEPKVENKKRKLFNFLDEEVDN